VWPVRLAQALQHPQLIFPSKNWFCRIYLNFAHQILLIKMFPTTPKAQSNSYKKKELRFNLIFSEETIQYSRTVAPQVHTSWN
jgi:hypothetical protein